MSNKKKWKWGLVTLVFLLFWALWVCMMIANEHNSWKDWAELVFLTLGLIVSFWAFAKTVVRDTSWEITDEHLVIKLAFGKKTLIPWSKIESFGTWNTQYQEQISVVISDVEKEISEIPTAFKRMMARLNYRFAGAIYFILEDTSGTSQEEQLKKLNRELKKHKQTTQKK